MWPQTVGVKSLGNLKILKHKEGMLHPYYKKLEVDLTLKRSSQLQSRSRWWSTSFYKGLVLTLVQ